jgi:DNA polymerase-3 subunit beta
MKIECIQERLAEAVSKAEKITSKNASLPILKCILLKATKEGLFINSTNLDIGIEIKIPAKVEVEGVVAIPGSILNSFLNSISSEKTVTLDLQDGNLLVSTPKTNTIIKIFPNDDYPTIPFVDTKNGLEIPTESLITGIKSVWYSSATSSIKPELSSVCVTPEDDSIVFVATDGLRLAEKTIKTKQIPDFSQILIPVKNAVEIIRVFEGVTENLKMVIEQNQIAISYNDIYLVSRIVEGNFPNYKAIIPKEFVSEVTILKQDLINCFKTSSIFTDSFNHTKFIIHAEEKSIEIITKNNNVGENSTSIPGSIVGESMDINFNYKYIMDALVSINSESLTLSFSGVNKPMIMKPVGDQSFLYLLMPMNR